MITVLPRPTWLQFISFNPVIWPSVLVCHSDYEDMIAFHGIEKLVGNLWSVYFLTSPRSTDHASGYSAILLAAFRTSSRNR